MAVSIEAVSSEKTLTEHTKVIPARREAATVERVTDMVKQGFSLAFSIEKVLNGTQTMRMWVRNLIIRLGTNS